MIVVADLVGMMGGTKEFAKRQKDRQTETDILSHALDIFSLQHTELRLVTGWSSSWLTPLGAARAREEDTILTSNCSC
jgi:hypothetical protein